MLSPGTTRVRIFVPTSMPPGSTLTIRASDVSGGHGFATDAI